MIFISSYGPSQELKLSWSPPKEASYTDRYVYFVAVARKYFYHYTHSHFNERHMLGSDLNSARYKHFDLRVEQKLKREAGFTWYYTFPTKKNTYIFTQFCFNCLNLCDPITLVFRCITFSRFWTLQFFLKFELVSSKTRCCDLTKIAQPSAVLLVQCSAR